MGRHGLYARFGHYDPDLWPARRPLWPQAFFAGRHRPVHHRLSALRQCRQHAHAGACTGAAGDRRRDSDRHGLRHRRRSVSRSAIAATLARVRQHGIRYLEHRGADPGRIAHAIRWLATRVLRQCAGRRRVTPARPALPPAPASRTARRRRWSHPAGLARRVRGGCHLRRTAIAY